MSEPDDTEALDKLMSEYQRGSLAVRDDARTSDLLQEAFPP